MHRLPPQQQPINVCQTLRFTQPPQLESTDLQAGAHASHTVATFHQGQAMAQAMLQQQQYQSELRLANQDWAQAGYPQHYTSTPTMSASPEYSAADATHMLPNVWGGGGAQVSNHGFSANSASHMPPYLANAGMGAYPTMGAPFNFGNKGMPQASQGAWPVRGTGGQRPRSLNGSEMESESDLSPSPKSYTSDMLTPEDRHPFTPASATQAIEQHGWHARPSPLLAMKTSASPIEASREFDFSDADWQQQPPMSQSVASPPLTPAEADYENHGLPTPPTNSSQDGQQYQETSPGSASWSSQGHAHGRPLAHQPNHSHFTPTINTAPTGLSYPYQNVSPTSQSREMTLYNGAQAQAPAAHQYQNRFQSLNMDATAERARDDQILLEGKRNGLTYKEIRAQLLAKGAKDMAESTLRGRYRSLTKPRNARVRKPVWSAKDIELLNKYVRKSLAHIDSSLGYDQRLGKVQWKKIADLIKETGGSYHFGNATCKRKWVEVSRGY